MVGPPSPPTTPPTLLYRDGKPSKGRFGSFDISIRLGAHQAEKLREIGDLKRSLTNLD